MEMSYLQQYIGPYIGSNVFAVILLILSLKWKTASRIVFILIFLAAGIFNLYTANTEPEAYTMYAQTALIPFYKNFIMGYFAAHAGFIISLIATGKILVAILLMFKKTWFKLGVAGALIFFISIAPLGVGSALPCTLIFAASVLIIAKKCSENTIISALKRKQSKP